MNTKASAARKTWKVVKWVLFALALALYLFYILAPILVMVSTSLKSRFEIQGVDTPIFTSTPLWENYTKMWRTIPLLHYIKNSLIICAFTVTLSMLVSIPASYALSRFRFRGKNAFSISVLATQLFPGIITLLPLFLMFVNFTEATGIKMVKSYQGLIISFATFGIPYSVWMLRSYFDSIPTELEEAATIDGCSRMDAMRKVVLPLLIPGLISTALYVFLLAWNNIMFAGVLSDQAVKPLSSGLRDFSSEQTSEFGQLFAACTTTTIPIIAMFLVLQKQFVSGLTGGAVKG